MYITSLFDDFFNFNTFDRYKGSLYYCDGEDVVVEKDVPGFSKDTLSVELDGRTLVVSGKTNERGIKQSLLLPRGMVEKANDFEAVVKDGILKVTLKGANSNKIEKPKKVKLLGD